MHLHHELQRALADTKIGAGGPPLRKQTEHQPDAVRFGRSQRAARVRVPWFAGRQRSPQPRV